MALGTPTLPVTPAGTGGTVATTGSFTPSANALLIAFAFTDSGIAYRGASVSDSLGGSWTQINSAFLGPNSSNFCEGRLYYQETGPSPAARTVSATESATTNGIGLIVVEITGNYSTDFSNVASNASAGSDPTVVLAAMAATSLGLAFAGSQTGGATLFSGFPSGYSSLANNDFGGSNLNVAAYYDLGSPGATQAWTHGSAANGLGIGLEVKEVAAGGGIEEPVAVYHQRHHNLAL